VLVFEQQYRILFFPLPFVAFCESEW
jgi:hypothetical protein